MVTPENWLPQKIDPKKRLPQTFWRTLLRGGVLLHLGKMAYFILLGFIHAIRTLMRLTMNHHETPCLHGLPGQLETKAIIGMFFQVRIREGLLRASGNGALRTAQSVSGCQHKRL